MPIEAILIDVVIVAILIFFAVRGAKRGLVLTFCSLAAVLVAFLGAALLSNVLAPHVAKCIQPPLYDAIVERLEASQEAAAPSPGPNDPDQELPLPGVLAVLQDMGIYQGVAEDVQKAVEGGLANTKEGFAAAVAQSLANTLADLAVFLAGFLLILILWNIMAHALNLFTRLPVIHTLNGAGGALLGFIKGCAIFFLAAWVVQFLGQVFPQETVEQTYLLKFFLHTNPLELLMGVQSSLSPIQGERPMP